MTVRASLLGTAQERAREILAQKDLVTLTTLDWTDFAKTRDDTEKPRPKLVAAIGRHREWQKR